MNETRLYTIMPELREPFLRWQIGRIPASAKKPAQDFVAHYFVTERLNKVCPDWTFSVQDRFDHDGQCWVLGTLTIAGISRQEFGDGSDPKSAIGNMLRRAAMRFGVAIDLWAKEDLQPASEQPAASGSEALSVEGERVASVGPVGVAAAAVVSNPAPSTTQSGALRGSSDGTDGDSAAYGEGAAGSSPNAIAEPHVHVPGRQLASGKYLCSVEGCVADPFKVEVSA